MGLVERKKSGNKFNGTKLIVEGQGISTVTKPTQVLNEKIKKPSNDNTNTN